MTLTELRAQLATRAVEADAQRATAPLGDTLRWLLAELATVNGNGGNGDRVPAPDRLLTAAEVAVRLTCSVRYVYAKAPMWPFTVRDGRLVRFSAAGFERWLARRP